MVYSVRQLSCALTICVLVWCVRACGVRAWIYCACYRFLGAVCQDKTEQVRPIA